MSTNSIDEMSDQEAKSILNDICSELGIGASSRTVGVILTNISNARRRSQCLGRIETYLSVSGVDEDLEVYEESLLNWGQSPDEYIETFMKIFPKPTTQ